MDTCMYACMHLYKPIMSNSNGFEINRTNQNKHAGHSGHAV
jgi:hypothetical protein